MPSDLLQLYRESIAKNNNPVEGSQNPSSLSSPSEVPSPLLTAIKNPLKVGQGVIGVVPKFLSGMKDLVGNAFKGMDYLEDIPLQDRAGALGNLASLGMSGMVYDSYKKNNGALDSTAWDVTKQVLPINEISNLYQGTNPETGAPLSPEEIGESLTTGILKTVPVVGAAGKVVSAFRKGIVPPGPRSLITKKMLEEPEPVDPRSLLTDQLSKQKNEAVLTKPENFTSSTSPLPKSSPGSAPPDLAPGIPTPKFRVKNPIDPMEYPSASRPLPTQNLLDASDVLKTIQGISNAEANIAVSDAAYRLSKGRGKAMEQVADMIATGQASPELFPSIMKSWNTTPEDIATVYADLVEKTGSHSGKFLNALSQYKKAFNKTFSDSPETLELLKGINDKFQSPSAFTSAYGKLSHMYSEGWLKLARSSMVSQVATTLRNIKGQGLNLGVNALDDAIADTMSALTGKVREDLGKQSPTKLSDHYANTLTDFTSVFHNVVSRGRSLTDLLRLTEKGGGPKFFDLHNDILAEVPLEAKRLGGPVADMIINGSVEGGPLNRLKAGIKQIGKGKDVYEKIDGWAQTATFLNNIQEFEFRRMFFDARKNQNMAKFGYTDDAALLNDLRSLPEGLPNKYFGPEVTPESFQSTFFNKYRDTLQSRKDAYLAKNLELGKSLDKQLVPMEKARKMFEGKVPHEKILADIPEVAELFGGKVENAGTIITDAVDHALKQTFSFSPGRGTLPGAILETYQKIPFLAGLGPYFPRFLMNQYRWLNDHSPHQLLGVFSKDFREELLASAANPKGMSKPAVQKLAKGMSGLVMYAGASFIRQNPELAGPKYYQIRAGKDKDGNEILEDLRAYQPFTSFLFFEEVVHKLSKGERPNISAAELLDATTGIRRVTEVPMFGIVDVIRSIDASSPDAFINALKPFIGQAVAAPFVPLRMMSDALNAVGVESAGNYKDTEGNELLGPAVETIPGVRNILPNRPDPYTGLPGSTQFPAQRQLLGRSLRSVTPLDMAVQESGLSLGDLLGNFDNPEANRMVTERIGKMLAHPVGDSTFNARLGDLISNKLSDKPIEYRREFIKKIFTTLRAEAKTSAFAENPIIFMEDMIRNAPEPLREPLRKKVEEFKRAKR